MPATEKTRLAPSPTGALHLGNARTFLMTWALARQNGWEIILRIEDIDGPRIKLGAEKMAIDDLQWLGIDWDSGPFRQSNQVSRYRDAALKLLATQRAYPCTCSRSEVENAASAPHASDGASVYSGTCRGKYKTLEEAHNASGRPACLRFHMSPAPFQFHDQYRGNQIIQGSALGDFPILKGDGTPSYQLACAVDDAETGITQVIRGDDLIESVPRQVVIMEALGLAGGQTGKPFPTYTHFPLVVGEDGRRLAKRHGDTRIATYREAGVKPQRIIELLGRWCGIPDVRSAAEFADKFDLKKLIRSSSNAHTPIVMSVEDDKWLRS